MFGGNFRKLTMVLDNCGQGKTVSSEGNPDNIQHYQQAFVKEELPFEVIPGNKGSFYFHVHEHKGVAFNPILVTMATETLLQHMGVAYIVDYDLLDRAFHYDPKK